MGSHIPAHSVRTSLAASTLAGLSVFGVSDDRREMTLISCREKVESARTEIESQMKVIQSFPLYEQASIVHRHPRTRTDHHPEHAVIIGELGFVGNDKCAYQDGYANHTIGINCILGSDHAIWEVHRWLTIGVPHRRDESHLWGLQRVL